MLMVQPILPVPGSDDKSKACDATYYKKRALIRAAKDLGYGEDVIKRLETACTDGEAERIMKTARKKKFG